MTLSAEAEQFLSADVDELVDKLKLDERISLLSAPSWWSTNAIKRMHIPPVRMSDGPNGVRGSSHFVSTPAQCLPCATSLAATFDRDLIERVGKFLGEETKIKAAVILLAPTCNIQRSPLGGRAFESFSEDPHLSGMLAAAYVNGLQSEGVAATIKHFVANDQEHERTAADSVMSERALREIYLYPFMLAQKFAKPQAFMTSYGRIDGVHCSENPRLLQNILREEWGFDGIIMSDWYGTYGTSEPLNAGLDLEMPGPPRWRQPVLVAHALSAQKVLIPTIDARAQAMLAFVQRLAKRNPDIVFGDGVEHTREPTPEVRRFCRDLAARGMVLLRNEGNVLPIAGGEKKTKVAVVGPNAKGYVISGGGSAALKASYVVTPFQGLEENKPDSVEISYHIGCYAHKFLPTLENSLTTPDGKPGWLCTFYNNASGTLDPLPDPIASFVIQDTRVKLNDFLPPGLNEEWTIKLTGKLAVHTSGPFEFGLAVSGRAKLFVNGKETIDNWTRQRPGEFFYGQGTAEEKAVVEFKKGENVDVLVVYTNTPSPNRYDEGPEKPEAQPALMKGVRLGGCPKIDADQAINDAAALAAQSDVVVFVGGLTPEWESEGFDRPTLGLPGRQDDCISAIAKANPKTVVVVQAGSAVGMPWASEVAGIVQAWYSGNEVGNAIADIIYGRINPTGRLPLTLPVRLEDTPAFESIRSEFGKIHYREDLFVGYKHYLARGIAPLFPFGFGLSYTTFEVSDLTLSSALVEGKEFSLTVSAKVTNTGSVAGEHVVQVYVSLPVGQITHPPAQLRGFTRTSELGPNESAEVSVKLDRYALAYWDERANGWRADAGEYIVKVGSSSADTPLEATFKIKKGFGWSGI